MKSERERETERESQRESEREIEVPLEVEVHVGDASKDHREVDLDSGRGVVARGKQPVTPLPKSASEQRKRERERESERVRAREREIDVESERARARAREREMSSRPRQAASEHTPLPTTNYPARKQPCLFAEEQSPPQHPLPGGSQLSKVQGSEFRAAGHFLYLA